MISSNHVWEVGQEVVQYGYGMDRGPVSVSKVKRIMKRFIELEDGSTWRHNGWSYPKSEGYHHPHIDLATDEVKLEIRRKRLCAKIEGWVRARDFEKVPVDVLESVYRTLAEHYRAQKSADANNTAEIPG